MNRQRSAGKLLQRPADRERAASRDSCNADPGILLLFVAAKMLLTDVIKNPPLVSLVVVASIFGVAIVASRLFLGATLRAAAEAPVACTHCRTSRHFSLLSSTDTFPIVRPQRPERK